MQFSTFVSFDYDATVVRVTKGYICLATDQLKMDLLFGRKILCYVYLS